MKYKSLATLYVFLLVSLFLSLSLSLTDTQKHTRTHLSLWVLLSLILFSFLMFSLRPSWSACIRFFLKSLFLDNCLAWFCFYHLRMDVCIYLRRCFVLLSLSDAASFEMCRDRHCSRGWCQQRLYPGTARLHRRLRRSQERRRTLLGYAQRRSWSKDCRLRKTDTHTDRQTNGQTDRRMDGWIDGWTNWRTDTKRI